MSASSRSSLQAPRATSAPGTFDASPMATSLRWSRIRSSAARPEEQSSRCAKSSRPEISSAPPIWNRPTRPRARTSRRPISTVSKIAGSDSTAPCNSARLFGASITGTMPAFIRLKPTISSSPADITTSNRRPARTAPWPAEIHPRGSATAIGVAPAAGRSSRMEMARPVQESNEIPAMLDAIARYAWACAGAVASRRPPRPGQ